MKDFIFIAGAPGIGKSTLAKLLQGRLGTPMFEFGWIPEFRYTGEKEILYEEEESIAFENLTMVLQNYCKHGFKNIIVTDLEDKRIQRLDTVFCHNTYLLCTLFTEDEMLLKGRVLDESRSSKYRDWEESIKINRGIITRSLLPNERRIDVAHLDERELLEVLVNLITE